MLHVLHCQCGGISAGCLSEPAYDRFTACARRTNAALEHIPQLAANICPTIKIATVVVAVKSET